MGTAGLPGTGLGGLFYLLLAFWLPVRELHLTARGRSSRERWRAVGTQFALAAGILAAVVGTVLLGDRTFGLTPRVLVWGLLPPVLLLVLSVVLQVWAWVATRRPPEVGLVAPPTPPTRSPEPVAQPGGSHRGPTRGEARGLARERARAQNR